MNLLCLCRRSKPTPACPNTGRLSMNWTMLRSVQRWRKWPWIKWGWGTEPPPLRASPRWRSSRSASLLAEDRTSRGGKRHTHKHIHRLQVGNLNNSPNLYFHLWHTQHSSVCLCLPAEWHTPVQPSEGRLTEEIWAQALWQKVLKRPRRIFWKS